MGPFVLSLSRLQVCGRDCALERLDAVTRAFEVSGACGLSRPGTPTRPLDQLEPTGRVRLQGRRSLLPQLS